jgi:hypothetical protein
MKNCILIFLALAAVKISSAQSIVEKELRYSLTAQFTQEVVLDGYVRVREWELVGDKMRLRDLGMDTYSAVQIRVEKKLRKERRLEIIYDQYFMLGSATFNRDITYNGTIIDGRTGIDVSPTRYYRVSLVYDGPLITKRNFQFSGLGGLVFDHIVFYLDGKVTASSPKSEVYEGFGRQAFPYPFIGLSAVYNTSGRGSIFIETSGTYIPEFKSFYTEGGNIHLQYSNFLADVKYAYKLTKFGFCVGGKFRHMRLFQESREDTNDLTSLTAGPYVELTYGF